MNKKLLLGRLGKSILKILGGSLLASVLMSSILTSYLAGFSKGYLKGVDEAQKEISVIIEASPTPAPTTKPVVKPAPAKITWGGPALWEAVNKRRVEFGVNPLSQRDELCTIASIRLNQLLDSGKLDGHEGFSKLPEQRPDLKWIFDKYNLSEFLVSGATSPQDAVALWENSLGHKKLLSGGEYSFGCIYAQEGFGVAIAAY
jgi:hypothetical protein